MVAGSVQDTTTLVVSVRYLRQVTETLRAEGFSTLSADWRSDLGAVFRHSSARIVVIDARGAARGGLDALDKVSETAASRGAAILFLVSANDHQAVHAALAKGATHFLVAPFRNWALVSAVHFANAYVQRLQSDRTARAVSTAQAAMRDLPRWEYDIASGEMVPSAEMVALLHAEAGPGPVSWRKVLHATLPADRRAVLAALKRFVATGEGGILEHRLLLGAGVQRSLRHYIQPRFDSAGRVTGLVATVEDADAARYREQLVSHFDQLTGLASQAYLRTWVRQLMEGPGDFEPVCVLIVVSISRFAQVNASYGRSVAEKLLQAVARRLRREMMERDSADSQAGSGSARLMARLGGAEFALAIAGPIPLTLPVNFAQQIAESFRRPFVVDGRVLHLTCRIGVASAEAEMSDPDTLFRRADAALAAARAQESNSFQIFSPGDDENPALLATLETDLRRAITNNRLEIYYQPQVDISTNRVVGAEALVRWFHPSIGLVPPETLIMLAENGEFGAALGLQILERTLTEAVQWTEPPLAGLRLAVNVAASQLRSSDFPDDLANVLSRTGFDANRLTLEITESGLMEDLESAAQVIDRVRATGVQVALDDFGTGYSSLAYLKSLAVDYIKVDRRFVSALLQTTRDRVLVHSMIEMARSLDMSVIAEGVETEEQLEVLLREGCTTFQGYLCSPPVAGNDLARAVGDWAETAASR